MPIKYAVPAGSARTRVLTALAARYTGGTVRGWDVLDGLDTHPASQNSGRFGYPFGKTRVISSAEMPGPEIFRAPSEKEKERRCRVQRARLFQMNRALHNWSLPRR